MGRKPSGIAIGTAGPAEENASVKVDSDQVVLSLPTGETVTILLHGATITSWTTSRGEHLFLSTGSALDGSAPIRGGIPLVFPVFGPDAAGKLPQHGFARISTWELLGRTSDSPTNVQVDFGLGPANLAPHLREAWPHAFALIYSVNLSQAGLETKILVRNEGEAQVEFNVLFHTYFKVDDISTVTVTGLQNTTYTDKLLSGASASETQAALAITGETDRVYASVPGKVTVSAGGVPLYAIDRSNLEDVVVWNPWAAGAERTKDFQPKDGWRNMLCVEAGSVARKQTLEAGSVWEGGQVVSLL